MWFASCFGDMTSMEIVEVSSTSVLSTYSMPGVDCPTSAIALGSDGNVWFANSYAANNTLPYAEQMDSISPVGTLNAYTIPSTDNPTSMVTGSDHNLWYLTAGAIRSFSLSTDAIAASVSTPNVSGFSNLVVNPNDGAVVFSGGNTVYRVLPSASPTISAMASLPSGTTCGSATAGTDGNLYFECSQGQKPTLLSVTQKTYTASSFPEATSSTAVTGALGYPGPIVFQGGSIFVCGTQTLSAPDGTNNTVWKLSPTGVLQAYYDRNNNFSDQFLSIAAGPNGSVWVGATDHTDAPYMVEISP